MNKYAEELRKQNKQVRKEKSAPTKKWKINPRIFDADAATIKSIMYLLSQYLKESGGQLASPSAELNTVSRTSPVKLCHSLSNICHEEAGESVQFSSNLILISSPCKK